MDNKIVVPMGIITSFVLGICVGVLFRVDIKDEKKTKVDTATSQVNVFVEKWSSGDDSILDKVVIDPWGSKIIFKIEENRMTAISSGPDRLPYTKDDIKVAGYRLEKSERYSAKEIIATFERRKQIERVLAERVKRDKIMLNQSYKNYLKSVGKSHNYLKSVGKSHNKRNKKSNRELRKVLLELDPFCYYCGMRLTLEDSTLDHAIPKSKGGSDVYAVLACYPCNQKKGDKIIIPWHLNNR